MKLRCSPTQLKEVLAIQHGVNSEQFEDYPARTVRVSLSGWNRGSHWDLEATFIPGSGDAVIINDDGTIKNIEIGLGVDFSILNKYKLKKLSEGKTLDKVSNEDRV